MKTLEIPTDIERKELFAFLQKNKDALIIQRKAVGKECAGFQFDGKIFSPKGIAIKAMSELPEAGVLNVKAVINTTNWLDACKDVHMPGLWTKSLNENKMLMHLQEHDMKFDKIISDGADLKAYTKQLTWKELGFDYKGKTEALIFDSTVRESRNEYMYQQYGSGYVKNHSVYMMYVKMVLCINEEEDLSYGAEYEAWQKYYPEIVNKEDADQSGYFWAVLEAKIIEGSAVPIGANTITPTLSVTGKQEPPAGTPKFSVPNIGLPVKGFQIGNYKPTKMLQ